MAHLWVFGADSDSAAAWDAVALAFADHGGRHGPVSLAAAVLCQRHFDVCLRMAIVAQHDALVSGFNLAMGGVAQICFFRLVRPCVVLVVESGGSRECD